MTKFKTLLTASALVLTLTSNANSASELAEGWATLGMYAAKCMRPSLERTEILEELNRIGNKIDKADRHAAGANAMTMIKAMGLKGYCSFTEDVVTELLANR